VITRIAPSAFCLALLACGNGGGAASQGVPTPSGVPGMPVAPPGGCTERIGALQSRFASIPDHPPLATVSADVARTLPVTARGLNILEPGVQVEIGRGVTMNGMEVSGADDDARAAEIAARWQQLKDDAQILGARTPLAIYVAAPVTESAERVVRLLAKVPDVDLRLLVRPADAPPAPPPIPIPARLASVIGPGATVDPAERAMRIATAMTAAVGTCTPLQRVFGAIAGVSVEQKAALLKVGVVEALQECNCQGVDMDALTALLVAAMDPGPVLSWVALPRTATGLVGAHVARAGVDAR